MNEDKKKYNYMEPILQHINNKFISLQDNEIKRNNVILQKILNIITQKMTEKDKMFKKMYSNIFYGGSFYDGLRVKHPNEFDLDLLLTLPKLTEPEVLKANKPGYVHVKLKNLDNVQVKDPKGPYSKLETLLNNNKFLDVHKVLQWIEGLFAGSLRDLWQNGYYVFTIDEDVFKAKIHKSGPAFTFKFHNNIGKDATLDVDLVPCFKFREEQWPSGFRKSPYPTINSFFIVPKPLRQQGTDHYWRLSFQEQERALINNKSRLKPTVRLLKQMRDIIGHTQIASYYLKTILMWQALIESDSYWNNSLSYVFMNALKEYRTCLESGEILYFWDKKNNLLSGIRPETLINMKNKVQAIINDVDRHPEDPYRIACYLLARPDYLNLIDTPDTELDENDPDNPNSNMCTIL